MLIYWVLKMKVCHKILNMKENIVVNIIEIKISFDKIRNYL